MENFKEWIIKAGIRAIKTFAQSLLGVMAGGNLFTEIPWGAGLSAATVAAIASLLMSIAGLPELKKSESNGSIIIGDDGNARIQFEGAPEGAQQVVLDVVDVPQQEFDEGDE